MNKNFTKNLLKGGTLALSIGFLSACMPEDDFQDIEIMAPSPSLALPIINTNLVVEDMINTEAEGVLQEKSDRSYSLFYRQSVYSKNLEEYVPEIPAQQFAERFSLGFNSPNFSISPEARSFDGKIPMDMGELDVYSIECKNGQFDLNVSSDYEHDVQINITFPDILDADRQPLQLYFELRKWGSRSSSQRVDLTNHLINLQNDSIRYDMSVNVVAMGGSISEFEQIYLDFNITDIDFSYLEGNFQDIIVPLEADTLEIPILASAVNGDVALNPSFTFNFQNSFGVKLVPDLSQVYVNRKSGTIVKLKDEADSDFFSGNFEFPYTLSRDDEPATKLQLVDRDNSNIEEAFAELPRGIAHDISFKMMSPENDTSFISDQSMIGLDLEVELPLEGSFDIILEDTIAIDLNFEQDIESLKMLIKTENGFPIDALLQVYFLDAEGNQILDSNNRPVTLFDEEAQLLNAAQITNTATGETKANTPDMPISATMNAKKYEAIRTAGNLLVRASMSSKSADQNMIKLYSFYNIRFSMAMQIKAAL
ncbi:MAG: hypothetical protein ACLFOZ_07515 [Cyclobacteriaceae bacterium]